MKKLVSTLLSLLIFFCTHAQNVAENEIRKLDNDQKEAYFRRDTLTLLKLFSPGVIINGFSNKFETLEDILIRIRKVGNDMEYYERIIEKIIFADNIAIVMGNETIKPSGIAINAGKTVKRRFTNIWMPTKKSWQLVARQSTIISIE
ncbi:MAG: nuclear transport factor 2 family protein [Chitinophagaceae bacterium]